MSSRKQQIYCELLEFGIIRIRTLFSAARSALKGCSDSTHASVNETLHIGFEEANFLHNINLSILEPDFVENDINFINLAFPWYINTLGQKIVPQVARLMLEFYDLVPVTLRPSLTWHPTKEFREFAKR
ncbi:MAG: hypothetical protein AB1489_41240 [Acidobacteriota bacterium]